MLTQSKLSNKRAKRNASRKQVQASRLRRKINDEAIRRKIGMPYRFGQFAR